MARLTDLERRSRLALDYRMVMAMTGNEIVAITAFGSQAAIEQGRPIDDATGRSGGASLYMADYRFPVLTGPGATTERTKVVFGVVGDSYPFSAPSVQVVSKPLPWSPHVAPGCGLVCIGDGWGHARGKMLLAGLIIHVARILNNDEPDREPHYTGWNGAAVKYWRTVMRCQPLTSNLPYPVLPIEITHGKADPSATAFTPVASPIFDIEQSAFIPREVLS